MVAQILAVSYHTCSRNGKRGSEQSICYLLMFNGRDIFMPTELLPGLYDGGHGAGLENYWNLMLSNPLAPNRRRIGIPDRSIHYLQTKFFHEL